MNNLKRIVMMIEICVCMFLLPGCKENTASVDILKEQDTLSYVNEQVTDCEDVCVYIVGEIMNPGVYELELGARVNDAVLSAGGFTEDAAKEYINLAKVVSDGEKIVIYSLEQVENNQIIFEEEASLININTAGVEELMTLPGIGESRANDIIKYREKNGRFTNIEDIMNVSGIKEAAFLKIEDLITVN